MRNRKMERVLPTELIFADDSVLIVDYIQQHNKGIINEQLEQKKRR